MNAMPLDVWIVGFAGVALSVFTLGFKVGTLTEKLRARRATTSVPPSGEKT